MSAKGWVRRKSTSWEVNGEYHRIESREHSAQTDVLEGTQTKWCGKFPNFNTTKKSASTKRWMMLCLVFLIKQENHRKKVCHKNLSQFVSKCRFVFSSPKIQRDESSRSFPPWAEVCGKVALHLSNAKAIRSTWFGRHVRRGFGKPG